MILRAAMALRDPQRLKNKPEHKHKRKGTGLRDCSKITARREKGKFLKEAEKGNKGKKKKKPRHVATLSKSEQNSVISVCRCDQDGM